MFRTALAYAPDEKLQSSFTVEAVINNGNTNLFGLLAYNKSASNFWLEIYDDPVGANGEPMELPLPAGQWLWLQYANGKKFANGVYVRAVSSQGGAIIASDHVKFTAEYMNGASTEYWSPRIV